MKKRAKIWKEEDLKHNAPNPLMVEVLDNLVHEDALGWLLSRIDEDRALHGDSLRVYRTGLFSIYVDYDCQTVFVSAELGCHPPDETFSLTEFYNTVKEYILTSPGNGERLLIHIHKKKHR